MAKKIQKKDALTDLLAAASPKLLSDLILQLAADWPAVRRECFDFLKSRVSVPKALGKRFEDEIVLSLWSELAPDLDEPDDCGGGDNDTEDHVAELLGQIRKRLESKNVGPEHRREILGRVLPYIDSGNAGLDDMLYDIAYAACYDDTDLRRLAAAFEAMKGDWKTDQARRIYRRLGDRDKYLELRQRRMLYGADYHDLATFYWESGEKETALQVAEAGLLKGIYPQGKSNGEGSPFAGRDNRRRRTLEQIRGQDQKKQHEASGFSGGVFQGVAGMVGARVKKAAYAGKEMRKYGKPRGI